MEARGHAEGMFLMRRERVRVVESWGLEEGGLWETDEGERGEVIFGRYWGGLYNI